MKKINPMLVMYAVIIAVIIVAITCIFIFIKEPPADSMLVPTSVINADNPRDRENVRVLPGDFVRIEPRYANDPVRSFHYGLYRIIKVEPDEMPQMIWQHTELGEFGATSSAMSYELANPLGARITVITRENLGLYNATKREFKEKSGHR